MKKDVQQKALQMRTSGKSIRDIASLLSISKSTASTWSKGVKLSDDQKENLRTSQRKGNLLGLKKYRNRVKDARDERIKVYQLKGKTDVGSISSRDLFITGLALYWGEGYKKSRGEVGFTNSDPVIICTILEWFRKFYSIQNSDFILRVSINNLHEKRVKEVEKHWSQITTISLSQFTKTSLIKTAQRKIYLNPEAHFGTLRVKVRNGTNLLERIRGALLELGKQASKYI